MNNKSKISKLSNLIYMKLSKSMRKYAHIIPFPQSPKEASSAVCENAHSVQVIELPRSCTRDKCIDYYAVLHRHLANVCGFFCNLRHRKRKKISF